MNWRQWLEQFLQLGLSHPCPLCQRAAPNVFCADCQRQLNHCQLANPVTAADRLPTFAWGYYEGTLKRAIAQLKYHQCPQIADPLGTWLGQAWLQHYQVAGTGIVVPIPLGSDRLRQRGYNQATLIAQSFCRVTGLALYPQGLQRIRNTLPQFNLSPAQRQQNLEKAFALGLDCQRRPPQQPVLLLDDIYTTGTTALSAIHTLNAAGITVRAVVTVARTERFAATPS